MNIYKYVFAQLVSFLEHIHEYDNDLSKPLDDFLPATLMERGLI